MRRERQDVGGAPPRKFMSLGSAAFSHSQIPPAIAFAPPQTLQAPPFLGGTSQERPEPQKALPDIFTTCPELRKLDMPMLFPSPVQNEFNLPRPAPKAIRAPPPHWGHAAVQRPAPAQQPFAKFDPSAPLISPHDLHFIPASEWTAQQFSLNDLRLLFFTRRNGIGRVFPIKLYHALLITKRFPDSYWFTGVTWVTKTVMKVNAHVFANLLGIHAVQGGLFHKQGNFSRHQFVQIMIQNSPEYEVMPECADVDDFSVRLFMDPQNRFTRDDEYEFSLDATLMNAD